MKQVKKKGSKIEIMLMKELWSRGLRYRKNVNEIYDYWLFLKTFREIHGMFFVCGKIGFAGVIPEGIRNLPWT